MENVTLAVAFLAGIVSFLSPCILPLIPGFMAYLAGTTIEEASARRREIFLTSLAYVLGFSVIFSALGILLNTLLESIAFDAQLLIARIGGVFIILFGLTLTGLIKIPFLMGEHKFRIKRKFSSRYVTAFLFGAAFAAGWTPCVGAVLGGILGLAASSPGIALPLLLSYSLGLGLPFLLVGLFTARANRLIGRLEKWLEPINVLFGLFLIAIGILIFTNNLSRFANIEFIRKVF